jgi:hypothetical protein
MIRTRPAKASAAKRRANAAPFFGPTPTMAQTGFFVPPIRAVSVMPAVLPRVRGSRYLRDVGAQIVLAQVQTPREFTRILRAAMRYALP